MFWLDDSSQPSVPQGRPFPVRPRPQDVFVTRLHVRYDNAHFPEDLVFQETADRTNFQGRYVLRHEWKGEDTCDAAAQYRRTSPERREREVQTLAALTGWDVHEIRKQAGVAPTPPMVPVKWWQRIWGQ